MGHPHKEGSRRCPAGARDEPAPEGDDWVEWGGQLIFAVDWTSGGAPIGISYEDWRNAERRHGARSGWALALEVLETLARSRSQAGAHIDVGRVVQVGSGLSREAYAADVTLEPDPDQVSDSYVVLLPGRDADPDLTLRTRFEIRLLAKLFGSTSSFRVPRPLGVLPSRYGLALARQFIRGVPLDLRAGRQPSIRPWQVVGQLAAAVHSIDVASVPTPPKGYRTRREHALAELAVFDDLATPEAREAHTWATENLPGPDVPGSLLHGDLLGQNVLLDPGADPPYAIIDWERATIGDPAYDLAIITRGVRQPFQMAGGFERLLEAYNAAAGGSTIRDEHVRLHELALAARWYREALARPRGEGSPPEEALARIRRVLQLAKARSQSR